MSKKITIGDKVYELKEVDTSAEGANAPVEADETPAEAAPVVEEVGSDDEAVDAKIDQAAEKIVAQLGLGDLHAKMDKILSGQSDAKGAPSKKASGLLDLERLMEKDVSEMTTKEKIVGFFQAMVQNNTPVLKALSEGTPADGGYLFPDEFRATVIEDIVTQKYRMRKEVTVLPMKRDVMNIPTLASRPQVTWTDENATKSTTTAHFGQVTLTVKKMAAILYTSDELIEDSTEVDIVNFIIQLFSDAIGQEEDRVVWRGNGTTEPTGITTAITASTIASTACAGNLSVDNLLNLVYALPMKYSDSAKFYVHRNNILEMRKLKDSNNRYYWTEAVTAGQAPLFLGYPVFEANELPESTIVFGDMKRTYWMGDRQKMTVKISNDTETAFTKDQTAIRIVERIAGNVVLGAASRALVSIP
jgi:HK97 family phage major capsid protein